MNFFGLLEQMEEGLEHKLIMKLSNEIGYLIDEKDVPGWTVNPAYDPEVRRKVNQYYRDVFSRHGRQWADAFANQVNRTQRSKGKYFAKMKRPA